MVTDDEHVYEGFDKGDPRPQLTIMGAGLLFFLTSCCLAFLILPSLFEHNVFHVANSGENVNPSPRDVQNIMIVIFNHLMWMLGPFIVSGYLLRKRRIGLALAILLLAMGLWKFSYIPLVLPGRVLLVGTWALSTAAVLFYWDNLD